MEFYNPPTQSGEVLFPFLKVILNLLKPRIIMKRYIYINSNRNSH